MIIRCDNCNKEFNKCPAKIKRSKNHFCSNKCQGEFQRLDLVGQKFGEFEVLEFDCVTKHRKCKYKCKCRCGNIVFVATRELKRGQISCKICSHRQYIGEVSGGYFSTIRYRAKAENKPFNITQKDIWEKFLEQDRKCAYSGIELTWQDGNFGERGTASVDRIDSKLGYTKDNIQIVHKYINAMKLNHCEEYFLFLCKKVISFDRRFVPILDYQQSKKYWAWKGYGEISGDYWGNIEKNGKYIKEKRGLEFNVTIEYIWDLYLKQGGVCALSGIPINFVDNYSKNCKHQMASLDRIDSLKGYVKGNVQWVHKDINKMKWNFNQNYFIDLCRKVNKNV